MEIRDLYDENKVVTGKTFVKGEQVPQGYFYLIVAVVIKNSKGEFLIQKRTLNKGGKWSLTAGHPKAGESSLDGLKSEVMEELGVDISNTKPILYKTITHNDQFFDLYYLEMDIDINDVNIQKEEVDDVKWVTMDEIMKMIENKDFHEGHSSFFLEYLKETDKL